MTTTQNVDFRTQNHSSKRKTDLKHRSYQFSLRIIFFVKDFPNSHIYWVFRDQLLRSATSIGANIIEAKASSSRREFIKFFDIALKSTNETIYWLELLQDSKLVDAGKIAPLLQEVHEIARMLGSSLITLKNKRKI